MKERADRSAGRPAQKAAERQGSILLPASETAERFRYRRIVLLSGAGYGVICLLLLLNHGYVIDLNHYKTWTVQAARFGVENIYRTSGMDYPPLYIYILQPLGKLYGWLTPGAMENLQHTKLLTALIKLPPLVFDLGIGWLLYRWTRHHFQKKSVAWIVAGAYLLNPAILFDGAYWGEPDSIHSFFILAAFITLGLGTKFWISGGQDTRSAGERSGQWLAWIFLTLATLMKPLGAPFFPLLFVLGILIYGLGRTALGMVAAGITTLVVFLPFLLTGQGLAVFHRVLIDTGENPFTSTNAHNLWWLLGAWRDAEVPWLGPFTATQIAMVFFGAAYAVLLWKGYQLHCAQSEGIRPPQIMALSAMVGLSFFMLSTHLHENHLFMVIPLLAPLLLEDRVWRWLFIAVSVAVLANLLLHDLHFSKHWPFTIGGVSQVQNFHLHRPFYVTELLCIWISTIFNLMLYGVAMAGVLRGRWLERLSARRA